MYSYPLSLLDNSCPCLLSRNYEDDFEPEDEDEILREEMLRLAESGNPGQRGGGGPGSSHSAEDIYDFSGTTNLGY